MQALLAAPVLRAIWIGGVTCALLSAGCATDDLNIGATFDPLTPFPATAVWSWDDAANKLPKDDRIDGVELDRTLKSAIASEFALKGYTESTGGKVQYVLSYEVGIHTWMSRSESRAFGTLSVLMTEAANRRKVWLGFLRIQIDMSLTQAQRDQRLREKIAEMLKNFPPSQPK